MTQHLFYLGKGGVGKSTLSAIESIKLAEQGSDTLLVSLDPAHNQSDIFEISFNDKPKHVAKNLHVLEINLEKQIKKYLSHIQLKIKQSYTYLTTFNLEKHFDIIQYSPGIEEYALLQAYNEIVKKYKDKKTIIFDMPPTALTLKFFFLPNLSLLWLEKLLMLRKQIIEKKQIITNVKFGKKKIETDKITNNLKAQTVTYQKINNDFQNNTITQIVLVMNPDTLSVNESIKIIEKLKILKLNPWKILINKHQNQNRA
ncbi:MAG: ArsA family ATPase, partial [Calditrichaceae bacterium]|nr:ArsA family ATPase [Calditrichaceae bacterium]